MRSMKPRVMLAAFAPMMLSLCAAGPPPEGVETQLYVGTGVYDYTSGGCGSPRYANRAFDTHGFGSVSYRHESGASVTGEVTGGYAKTMSSRLLDELEGTDEYPPTDEQEVGKELGYVNGAVRIGYNHKYFGVALGPAVHSETGVIPSGELWAGVPQYVFVYGEVGAGPVTSRYLPAGAGLGHSSERVRAQLGFNLESRLIAAGSYKVSEKFPLFVGARLVQEFDPQLMGTLGGLTLAYGW